VRDPVRKVIVRATDVMSERLLVHRQHCVGEIPQHIQMPSIGTVEW
jgi:hypothetical protein